MRLACWTMSGPGRLPAPLPPAARSRPAQRSGTHLPRCWSRIRSCCPGHWNCRSSFRQGRRPLPRPSRRRPPRRSPHHRRHCRQRRPRPRLLHPIHLRPPRQPHHRRCQPHRRRHPRRFQLHHRPLPRLRPQHRPVHRLPQQEPGSTTTPPGRMRHVAPPLFLGIGSREAGAILRPSFCGSGRNRMNRSLKQERLFWFRPENATGAKQNRRCRKDAP
jgi:hypothetical protein